MDLAKLEQAILFESMLTTLPIANLQGRRYYLSIPLPINEVSVKEMMYSKHCEPETIDSVRAAIMQLIGHRHTTDQIIMNQKKLIHELRENRKGVQDILALINKDI